MCGKWLEAFSTLCLSCLAYAPILNAIYLNSMYAILAYALNLNTIYLNFYGYYQYSMLDDPTVKLTDISTSFRTSFSTSPYLQRKYRCLKENIQNIPVIVLTKSLTLKLASIYFCLINITDIWFTSGIGIDCWLLKHYRFLPFTCFLCRHWFWFINTTSFYHSHVFSGGIEFGLINIANFYHSP